MRLVLLLLLLPTLALASPADLGGTWVLDQSDHEAVIDEALETTVQTMPATWRPFARPRMRANIEAVETYAIRAEEGRILVSKDGTEPTPIHLDDAVRDEVFGDGKAGTVRGTPLADGVRHTWVRPDSEGSTTFRLIRGSLVVDRVIDSKHFGVPIAFQLRYARQR